METEIDFRMWSFVKSDPKKSKMFYDTNIVMECLKQQKLFDTGGTTTKGFDHISDGSSFLQFSSFKDVDGIKIFQGDVLKVVSKTFDLMFMIVEIRFEKGSFVCYNKFANWGLLNRLFQTDMSTEYITKVIGNIKDNPELIITNN